MDKKTKAKAIELLVAKKSDPSLTYADIERKTGYSRRQLIRISRQIDERGAEGAAEHGNTGRKPAITATEDEVRYLREFKKPYESITIAQFRDIFIEDVIDNPDKRDDVERYGLVARSRSWFRELFRREGWRSPAQKPERAHGGRVSHPLRDPMPRRGMLVQVDGTPYDWLGNGDARVLHLAVDDATTEVLDLYSFFGHANVRNLDNRIKPGKGGRKWLIRALTQTSSGWRRPTTSYRPAGP